MQKWSPSVPPAVDPGWVIDVAAMLGLRVDAHPGSTAGGTDGLHFCMPGPLDYALDIVLARVGSAFDSPVPEIDHGAE